MGLIRRRRKVECFSFYGGGNIFIFREEKGGGEWIMIRWEGILDGRYDEFFKKGSI